MEEKLKKIIKEAKEFQETMSRRPLSDKEREILIECIKEGLRPATVHRFKLLPKRSHSAIVYFMRKLRGELEWSQRK